MGNIEKNKQFYNVCKTKGIIDPGIKEKFHRYLQKYYYKESNKMSFKELLRICDEFLETT